MIQEKIVQLARWYQQVGPLNWAAGASKLMIYLPERASERDKVLFMLLKSWFPSQSRRLAEAKIRIRAFEARSTFFDPPIYVRALSSEGTEGSERSLNLTIHYKSGETIQIPDDWIERDVQALTEQKIWARPFDKAPLRYSEEAANSRPTRNLRPRYRPFHHPPTNAKKRIDSDEQDMQQHLPPDVVARLRVRKLLMEQ